MSIRISCLFFLETSSILYGMYAFRPHGYLQIACVRRRRQLQVELYATTSALSWTKTRYVAFNSGHTVYSRTRKHLTAASEPPFVAGSRHLRKVPSLPYATHSQYAARARNCSNLPERNLLPTKPSHPLLGISNSLILLTTPRVSIKTQARREESHS